MGFLKNTLQNAKLLYRLIRPNAPNQRSTILKHYFWSVFSGFNYSKRSFWLVYQPDSNDISHLHPEMQELYKAWIRGNRLNNNGDLARFYSLILNIKKLFADKVPGDFAELGVWRGNSAAVLAHFSSQEQRKCFLFDTFEGFDERDLQGIDAKFGKSFTDTSIDYVKQTVGDKPNVVYVPGYFPESITQQTKDARYAFVNIDCDLYEPMKQALNFFYPRLNRGGFMFLHDYASGLWGGSTQAIDEFTKEHNLFLILLPDKSGTAIIRKSEN
ncbi:MAG: class I SAM-dependent methyltransferase [Chitinophagaceae bacterium]|nr:class I SAM-dependent methyltransferase [Chitinophagaceae bacterium]